MNGHISYPLPGGLEHAEKYFGDVNEEVFGERRMYLNIPGTSPVAGKAHIRVEGRDRNERAYLVGKPGNIDSLVKGYKAFLGVTRTARPFTRLEVNSTAQ